MNDRTVTLCLRYTIRDADYSGNFAVNIRGCEVAAKKLQGIPPTLELR